jgi:hypothetical protein
MPLLYTGRRNTLAAVSILSLHWRSVVNKGLGYAAYFLALLFTVIVKFSTAGDG